MKVLAFRLFIGIAMCSWGVAATAQDASWEELTAEIRTFYQRAEFDHAIEVAQHALRAAEREFGSKSLQAAQSLADLSTLYRVVGREAEARTSLKRARTIREKHGLMDMPGGLHREIIMDEAVLELQR